MGYYVRELKNKKKAPFWKLRYISYKKKDQRSLTAKMPKRTWYINSQRWPAVGLHGAMTANEAKARVKQLNAQLQLKKQEEHRIKIVEEEAIFKKRHDSVLPEEFVSEFEKRFVRSHGHTTKEKIWRRFLRCERPRK